MLVLSRKKGESIVINDHIEITVLGVEGETVRIGVSAPKNIDIFRKEVYDSIQEANRGAVIPAEADIEALMRLVRDSHQNK
ncbi:carbon storage regulator [Paenibacillus macquariensis subsp. defensor]|nr:carbon storage regulator [Paenibacillus macquariensis subsp. defensor]